jgi:putative PIN family toxin of toxin-antitoxin system
MKLVVQDASVLIDLAAADLLEVWFSLGIETLTSSFVWREVNRRSQKAKLRKFARDDRIQVVGIGAEVLSKIVRLKMDLPAKLSLNDASVLHLAVEGGAVLLTGDRNLRTAAESRKVTVYGVPELMDYMLQEEALSAATAITKLELLCRLNPRLSKKECEVLVTKWRTT